MSQPAYCMLQGLKWGGGTGFWSIATSDPVEAAEDRAIFIILIGFGFKDWKAGICWNFRANSIQTALLKVAEMQEL